MTKSALKTLPGCCSLCRAMHSPGRARSGAGAASARHGIFHFKRFHFKSRAGLNFHVAIFVSSQTLPPPPPLLPTSLISNLSQRRQKGGTGEKSGGWLIHFPVWGSNRLGIFAEKENRGKSACFDSCGESGTLRTPKILQLFPLRSPRLKKTDFLGSSAPGIGL